MLQFVRAPATSEFLHSARPCLIESKEKMKSEWVETNDDKSIGYEG